MNKIIKKIKLQKEINHLRAHLVYPKVVVFEDSMCIFVVDLICVNTTSEQELFTFDSEIVQYVFDEDFLWLVLKSSEVYVISLLLNSALKIVISNFANYKISGFEKDDNNIVLVSVSGERLVTPLSKKELCIEFENGVKELQVSLQKNLQSYKCNSVRAQYNNGLYVCAHDRSLSLTCPVTGITDKLPMPEDIDYIVPWEDAAVVSSKQQMWLLDSHFNKLYDFEKINSQYIPLGSNENVFYYASWDTNVQFYSSSLKNIDSQDYQSTNISTRPETCQNILQAELKALVQEALESDEVKELQQFHKLFSDVEDLLFLIGLASKLCKHKISYKPILCSIQKRVFLSENITVINAFHEIMIKLDLLEYIYFRAITHYSDVDIFKMNIIEICELFVSKSDLDLASICWLKFLKLNMTPSSEDILKILYAIPVNIKLGALVIWLRNFFPSLLDHNPFNIDLVAKWTTDRIFSLEQSTFWPKIGLKYVEAIIDVLESSQKTITIRPISIDDLDVIKDHIKYIMELKDRYKINMLISEVTSQSPTEVALIMLRRCYTEDLELFLRDNLSAFANRYQFDLDVTIRSFIEMQTASSGGSVDGLRLEILLNAIHSLTNRLECLLLVLKYLDVPWDNKVTSIAKSVAALPATDFTLTESDRNLAQAVYEELRDAQFKVILKKYNFPSHSFDYTSVIHKLISANNFDLDDLTTMITYVPTHSVYYANLLYIDKCLKLNETKVALEYFNALSNREKKILIKSVVNQYEQIIISSSNKGLERNYLDFLKGSHYYSVGQINTFEKMYHLKHSYNATAQLNELCNEEYYDYELNRLKTNCNINNSGRSRCMAYLVRHDFTNSLYSNLETLLHKTSTNQAVRTIIEQLICFQLRDSSSREIINMFKNNQNEKLLLLSQGVLCDVIWNCPEECLHLMADIMSMLNTITNVSTVMKHLSIIWKFNYVFLPMSSGAALHRLVDFYVNNNNNSVHCDESDVLTLRLITKTLVQNFFKQQGDNKHLVQLAEKVALKLLHKVVTCQDLDQVTLTSLLLQIINHPEIISDKTNLLDILRGRCENFSPSIMYYLSSPAIRQTFSFDNAIPGNTLTYPPQYILKSKFKFDLEEIALPDCTEQTWDEKLLLFCILKKNPDTTFERLVDLCQTLNVNINDGLSLLLISLLINWDLQYKISVDDLGCRHINLENKENELVSKCLTIWQNIQNKDFLKDVLKDFWKNGEVAIHGFVISINPYFYEVLLCIYYLLVSSHSEHKYLNEYFILNFLKEYQRKGAPKQYEFELFSVKGLFPEIGHYRLPFHLFMRDDMWANFKTEITLETYERWLPVVGCLSLNADTQTAKDMICSNAVKQTMTSRESNNATHNREKGIWKLISTEEPLLRTAHRCVRHIANMEWAGACLFYVLQGCARGADQVAAAQLCYQFTQRWAAVQPGNRAVRQMERQHSTLSTRHALHKIDWASEEFICLITEPTRLIHSLYMHPNFVEKNRPLQCQQSC
ncbi:unnamed protein product [Leptosia nina]|uniref:RZZ complex subunit KNTC1/ROD C-terminal domain-containing protein n=1 Tax=Leptosia nina TaxID=320188 RepID=A0AAV1J8S7_9NEOP